MDSIQHVLAASNASSDLECDRAFALARYRPPKQHLAPVHIDPDFGHVDSPVPPKLLTDLIA
jgi:hypothetical protein